VVHQVAYQLIVTHRGPIPNREHPPNEWEFSNPRFNGQKRSEIRAIAIAPAGQRYGWPTALSTAAGAADLKPLQRLQHVQTRGFKSISGPGN
jgi:ribosomal protein S18 acetylase RimI-like enzyme